MQNATKGKGRVLNGQATNFVCAADSAAAGGAGARCAGCSGGNRRDGYHPLHPRHALSPAAGLQASELRSLGALGYDAVTFGNHEYDYRAAGLASIK